MGSSISTAILVGTSQFGRHDTTIFRADGSCDWSDTFSRDQQTTCYTRNSELQEAKRTSSASRTKLEMRNSNGVRTFYDSLCVILRVCLNTYSFTADIVAKVYDTQDVTLHNQVLLLFLLNNTTVV